MILEVAGGISGLTQHILNPTVLILKVKARHPGVLRTKDTLSQLSAELTIPYRKARHSNEDAREGAGERKV